MKNIRFFLSENFHFLVAKFSIYLNRRVFVMILLAWSTRLDINEIVSHTITTSNNNIN